MIDRCDEDRLHQRPDGFAGHLATQYQVDGLADAGASHEFSNVVPAHSNRVGFDVRDAGCPMVFAHHCPFTLLP